MPQHPAVSPATLHPCTLYPDSPLTIVHDTWAALEGPPGPAAGVAVLLRQPLPSPGQLCLLCCKPQVGAILFAALPGLGSLRDRPERSQPENTCTCML